MLSLFTSCAKASIKKLPNLRFLSSTAKMATNTSVDAEEVKKFDSSADSWWHGKMYEALRNYNSVRVPFIRDGILSTHKRYEKVGHPLEGFAILDVGCGGGILAEQLARLGAHVTGLDPGPQNIQAAADHASKDPELKDKLCYICDTIENLATKDTKYDAVVCSEVVEHVDDVKIFVQSCVEVTKNTGSLFFTTINKTYLSYFLSIMMAEYFLGLVPRGTHEWNKFVKPKELSHILESLDCSVVSVQGVTYNPLTKNFAWCKSTSNLYALQAVKQ